jgi:hypothetical protein
MTLPSADGSVTLTLVQTDPTPLDRGDNTWTVLLLDGDGVPLVDASVVLEPTMPGHGHGTFPATFEGTATDVAGTFTLGPFDLMMPGTWLLTFTVTPLQAEAVTIQRGFCIES